MLMFGLFAVTALALTAVGLFGIIVAPTDATLYTLAAAVVLTVSVLASYWPARRTMTIDPTVALRQ
jgi:ABC-type lipoprotein release transport system permease subunit